MTLTEEILAGVPKPKAEAERKEGGDSVSETTPTPSSSQSEVTEGGANKEAGDSAEAVPTKRARTEPE